MKEQVYCQFLSQQTRQHIQKGGMNAQNYLQRYYTQFHLLYADLKFKVVRFLLCILKTDFLARSIFSKILWLPPGKHVPSPKFVRRKSLKDILFPHATDLVSLQSRELKNRKNKTLEKTQENIVSRELKVPLNGKTHFLTIYPQSAQGSVLTLIPSLNNKYQ